MVTVKTAAGMFLSGLALVALSATTAGAKVDGDGPPAGRNGTIHIDGIDLDENGGNEPHDTCGIEIEYTGFDVTDLTATASFHEQGGSSPAPIPIATGNATTPLLNGAGGETYTLDLTGLTPHPTQGYHVRIDILISPSNAAKSKVIWLGACDPASASPSPSASVEPSESVSPSASNEPSESVSPSASAEPSESVSPSASAEPSESASPSESAEPSESVSPGASAEPSESGGPSESASVSPTELSGSPAPSSSTSKSPSASVKGVKIRKPLPATGAPFTLLLGTGLGLAAAGAYLLLRGRARAS